MKIRSGFVANSSSSSFVIIGRKIPMPTEQPEGRKYIFVHDSEYEDCPFDEWDEYQRRYGDEDDDYQPPPGTCIDVTDGICRTGDMLTEVSLTNITLPSGDDVAFYFGWYRS